jgi:hypothetical protein
MIPDPRPVSPLAPGRHWWSLAPVPVPAARISARRAYAEALGVYLAFFGASIVVAAGTLAGFNVDNPEGWWVTGSDGFDEIARAALAVTVVVLLAGRRGRSRRDIGIVARRAAGGPGLSQGIRISAWAVLAFIAGGIVTSALATGHFPFGHREVANTLLDLTAALNAGVVEEIVVLGFLVTTLEHAGRPRVEIAVVALICRGAYHIYYGPGALGILVWAAVFLWLFWRFRSVVPMVITHICWDGLIFLGQAWSAFGAIFGLLILALLVTAFVLWLVDRSARSRRKQWNVGAWPPPHPGSPYPGSPYPGSPYPGTPYPGAPYPGAPYPGAPYPGAPYPGSPATGSQWGPPAGRPGPGPVPSSEGQGGWGPPAG